MKPSRFHSLQMCSVLTEQMYILEYKPGHPEPLLVGKTGTHGHQHTLVSSHVMLCRVSGALLWVFQPHVLSSVILPRGEIRCRILHVFVHKVCQNSSACFFLLSLHTGVPVPPAAVPAVAAPIIHRSFLFPSFRYSVIFFSAAQRILFQNWAGCFRCSLAKSNLTCMLLRLIHGLHLEVTPLYLRYSFFLKLQI